MSMLHKGLLASALLVGACTTASVSLPPAADLPIEFYAPTIETCANEFGGSAGSDAFIEALLYNRYDNEYWFWTGDFDSVCRNSASFWDDGNMKPDSELGTERTGVLTPERAEEYPPNELDLTVSPRLQACLHERIERILELQNLNLDFNSKLCTRKARPF